MTVQQEISQNTPVTTENIKQDNREYNFSQLNKKYEMEKQARMQAEAKVSELEKLSQSRKRYEDEDDDEPYVDHKRLEKKLNSFEEKIEKKIDERAEMKARVMFEEERKSLYLKENNDFHNVMSEQNLQKFAEKNPSLAKTIMNMPDGFEKSKLVYETMKSLGIDKPEQKQSSIQDKIDANKRIPYYQPTGIANSPYNNGGDFSESGQKSAYAHMMALKKRLSYG